MKQWQTNQRDAGIDGAQVFQYKGYSFPKYEGHLTKEEYNSKQNYYSFWGGGYMTARALRYRITGMIEERRIPIAA